MHVSDHVPLAPLTTLRLGGPARKVITVDGAADIADLFASSDHDFSRLFVLGGGSNMVVRDEGYEGTIVRFASAKPELAHAAGKLRIESGAGASWDDLVALAVDAGGRGMECLAGIPGQVGAAPIQNIGAYGQEVKRTIVEVQAFRRSDRSFHRLAPAECRFAYRHSRFKEEGDWIVCGVTFELELGAGDTKADSDPIDYPELARALGVHLGDSAPVSEVRATVIALRKGKGMVLDAADPESVSAGSFFMNPILDEADYEELMDKCPEPPPRFAGGPGKVKTSAAWLIERAGFTRGYSRGAVGISRKHALALVNRGGTTAELLALAAEIQDGVRARFGVELVREPVLL